VFGVENIQVASFCGAEKDICRSSQQLLYHTHACFEEEPKNPYAVQAEEAISIFR
jgi:hypothetical protein